MTSHPQSPPAGDTLHSILIDYRINVEKMKPAEAYVKARAHIDRLLAKRELEGRIDVWVQLINTLRFVIEHKRQETSEEAAKHWKEKAEEVLAELREELAKYE